MNTVGKYTRGEIIREGVNAVYLKECTSEFVNPKCEIIKHANAKDLLFSAIFNPFNLFTMSIVERDGLIRIAKTNITSTETILKKHYGDGAPVNNSWWMFPFVKWNVNGTGGGNWNNTYFNRNDLSNVGYNPKPIFTGPTGKEKPIFENIIPNSITKFVPVFFDRFFNPALTVMLFIILIAIITISKIKKHYYKKKHV
jgi:hypothetical protein